MTGTTAIFFGHDFGESFAIGLQVEFVIKLVGSISLWKVPRPDPLWHKNVFPDIQLIGIWFFDQAHRARRAVVGQPAALQHPNPVSGGPQAQAGIFEAPAAAFWCNLHKFLQNQLTTTFPGAGNGKFSGGWSILSNRNGFAREGCSFLLQIQLVGKNIGATVLHDCSYPKPTQILCL